MNSTAFRVSVAGWLLWGLITVSLHAQQDSSLDQHTGSAASSRPSTNPSGEFKGFNMYESFQGGISSGESIFKLDSTIGYDFNRYIGVFTGVPVYFVHDSTAADNLSGAGAGDVYFGLDLFAPTRLLNYSSSLTVSTPTGSVSKGFSTGHRTVDWTNRIRRRFGHLAPFAAAGVSNSVPDTDLVTRTFSSLGNIVHLEEGSEYDLAKRVYAGASAYHIIPFGHQEVFNRVDGSGSPGTSNGDGSSPSLLSGGGPDLTRENGFDAWLGFEPARVLRLEIGYSRSVTFDLNRLSLFVGMNVGKLLRWQSGGRY